jgi:hypothetical protein
MSIAIFLFVLNGTCIPATHAVRELPHVKSRAYTVVYNSDVAGKRFDLYTVMQFMGLDYRIFSSR